MKIIINILYFTIHFYCIIFTYVNAQKYVCKEPELPRNELITGVKIDNFPPNSIVKRTDDKFRIHLEYLPSFSNDPDAELLKKQFLEPAIEVLRSAIKPKIPVRGILRIERKCVGLATMLYENGKIACAYGCEKTQTCKHELIPGKFLKKCKTKDIDNNYVEEGPEGEGVPNTDLVILVIRKPCDPGTLAWALSCALEETLDRPILGLINVCTNTIHPNENTEKGVNTIVHELVHVLGFSRSRYPYFRDRDGNPLVPRDAFNSPNLGIFKNEYNFNDKIAKEVIRHRYSKQLSYTKTVYALTLPTVVKEAQEFFNCPSLTEVDLEDLGGSGTSMSHFDEYVFRDELMSPVQHKVQNMTRLTLAFLYDTGWYDVDYCAAKPMEYGYKAGCTLPLEGCYKYMKERKAKGQSIDPFCEISYSEPYQIKCSSDFKNLEFCSINKIKDPKYAYLEDQMSGDIEIMEYCPVYLSEPCETKESELRMAYPIHYGKDSRCVKNTIRPGRYDFSGATCLKTTCESDKYTLKTKYGELTCVDSKDISVNSGTLQCYPQGTMCPITDGTACGINNETEKYLATTTENYIWNMETQNTSNNIQISLFYVLFYFMVLICLLP